MAIEHVPIEGIEKGLCLGIGRSPGKKFSKEHNQDRFGYFKMRGKYSLCSSSLIPGPP